MCDGYLKLKLPDGFPRYILLIIGYVYTNIIKISGNENYPTFSNSKGKYYYHGKNTVITR